MIYVCIPTHNEATTLGVLLWKTRKVLDEFDRPFVLVVHDDASTDDTPEVLERYKRALPADGAPLGGAESDTGAPSRRLLRHVQDVAPYPKRDCAVVMQADFTEDPQDVVSLVKILEGGADIVAGSAAESEQPQPSGVKLARRLARRALPPSRGSARRSPTRWRGSGRTG